MKWYTGVGSRETPEDMQAFIRLLAYKLANDGFHLRSGAAEGADKAFEAGWWNARMDCVKVCPFESYEMTAEIFIPWSGFNQHTKNCKSGNVYLPDGAIELEAEQIAAKIHPAWERCSPGAKKLHTRNVFQVLGKDLDAPSTMLICWAKQTKGGNILGGTATAWNLARSYNVPCFNLADPKDFTRIQKFMET